MAAPPAGRGASWPGPPCRNTRKGAVTAVGRGDLAGVDLDALAGTGGAVVVERYADAMVHEDGTRDGLLGRHPTRVVGPGQPLRKRCDCSTARRSTTSFMVSPECPLTQRKVTSPRSLTSSTRGSQRSRLTTGFFCDVSQPRAIQPRHHPSRKQLTT